MRKVVFFFAAAVLAACSSEGYSEYSLISLSDFEYTSGSFTDSLYLTSAFYGGSSSYELIFYNDSDGSNMTGGFGMTMKRDSSLVLKDDNAYPQYTMFANAAYLGSNVCAVFCQNNSGSMPDHDIVFDAAKNGTCAPAYCAIANTQAVVYSVLSDESTLKFEPGDYLKLTITGSLGSTTTGSVEYYLADYRGSGAEPDSVLTTWQRVPLTKLGNVQYIDFELESNKDDLPMGFCFDYLVASMYVKYE